MEAKMGFFKELANGQAEKAIQRVNILGVRTGEETRVMATYNSTVYSLLILYTDGTRSLKEVQTKDMGQYLQYIPIV